MRTELAALARELMNLAEPGPDHLTIRASCSGGGGGYRVTSGPSEQDEFLSGHPETLFKLGLERPVVFEMRVRPDGTFDALVTENIIQATGHLPPTYTVLRKQPRQPSLPAVSSLAEVEAVIGAPLPQEVHELYASGAQIDDDIELYPPDEILLTWSLYKRMAEEDPQDWAKPVLYVGPPGAVRMVNFHPLWVPIASNHWGDNLCVDLAPGPGGRVGQMIQLAGEAPLSYLADSATAWARSPESPDHEGLEDHFKVADRGPEGVAALPLTTQSLSLHDPGDLDFGLLARLTSLRRLGITGGDSVRLGALAHLPLERIEVTAREIELPACETLTSLAVRGAHVELPSLPQLRVLDVSGAEVDIESLPQVDYLVLNADQWRRCSLTPAAASLTGEYSLARALMWASERGVELSRQVISGRAG